MTTLRTFAIAALIAATAAPALAATLVLNNVDAPNVGFNDPTPATPVGGNAGTTVGEQRLVAYRKALELWGKTLRSSVTIVVQGSFAGLSCDPNSGVLAQAGAIQIFTDFPNAPLAGHWYHSALANALAGEDLSPGGPDPGPLAPPYNDDIVANFNGNVGKPGCIEGSSWYYGLDNQAPPSQIDFLDTFMHEVAHGLGFSNFANEATGARPLGLPDVYMANTFDLTLEQPWNTTYYEPFGLTAAFIRFSAVNTGNVVWNGPAVTANAPKVLGPAEGLRATGTLTREFEYGTAAFGPAPTPQNFGGLVALAVDAGGAGTLTDGCEPITSDVAGMIAILDRGTCAFTIKVKNAQNAGARGVIVVNTAGGSAFDMGGADATITIPSIGISTADGSAIKAALPGVSVEFFTDPTQLAGVRSGFVRLYAPSAVALGSSISHFDTVATPNLLMEPFISSDLRSASNLDLTPALMQDIGWKIESLKIGTCDTGVPNYVASGDLLHVKVEACQAESKHGRFMACINRAFNPLVDLGLLTAAQKDRLTSCAARSR